ncbi:hypothetical protein Nepgr_026349 [Nepenthes gracilis]|uniref:Spatacsin C-terminal domain-containing protein n=1 Tax=Nepenthes gracilis TaxID=150966 RepID=A0AAD3T8F3_NEPGR|nr:hypothetical protein Nepgr_026349 [Nepenthes gracilis]
MFATSFNCPGSEDGFFTELWREQLLLLSHHCEALLLPLTRGDLYDIDHENGKYENQENVHSLSPPELTEPCSSTSRESVVRTSKSASSVSNDQLCHQYNTSQCKDHAFVFDVNSLAWGVCGDTYAQPKEIPFRELLFVCGNHGVSVHAFYQHDESDEMFKSPFGGEGGHGRWVEWGPSAAFPSDIEAQSVNDSRTDGAGENPSCSGVETSNNLPESLASKKWLRSFFTSAETKESDGIIRTWFPEKVFPCSTKIISFSLFNDDSSFLGFLSRGNSALYGVSKEKTGYEPVHDLHKTAELNSLNSVSIGMSITCKCSKVFSSNSYHFVGFVVTLVDDAMSNSSDACDNSWNKVAFVASLDMYGMQWLCSVNLARTNVSAMAEWTDFQFSDSFLICLNALGMIFFYGVSTGEYVAHFDISQMYGIKAQQKMQEQEKYLLDGDIVRGIDTIQSEKDDVRSSLQNCGSVCTRKFRRLIVASFSSLIAVVDEFGVVYVLSGRDLLPEKYYPFEKLLPQYSRLDKLAAWEVGYSDINCQKVSLTFSGCREKDRPTRSKLSSHLDDFGSGGLQTVQDWSLGGIVNEEDLNLSGFTDSSQKNNLNFAWMRCRRLMRNIFLPITRSSADDAICFSSLGITRLIRRYSIGGRKSCHIVHTNFHIESIYGHDRCLNYACGTHDLHIKEEALVGEAIGCISQGCLYLVTGDGLSVVLPCISVSSDFHPVESIAYPSSRITQQQSAHQAGDFLVSKEQRQLCSPWKVEILDRVLIQEGPVEADRLCLENGWDIKVSRLRRLQLALGYSKFDEMELSLGMLEGVNMAEEAVLRLILAAVYMMFCRVGNDSEISAASRILALATRFAIKMIRKYAMSDHSKNECAVNGIREVEICSPLLMLPYKEYDGVAYMRKMKEMAHYLEIIRNLQCRAAALRRRPGQGSVADGETQNFVERNLSLDDSQLSIVPNGVMTLEKLKHRESALSSIELGHHTDEKLALMPVESSGSEGQLIMELNEVSFSVPEVPRQKFISVENPKEMIARWEMDNLDLKNVVKDALLSGRLPLAVLQLHLHRLKAFVKDKEPSDTFTEVLVVGRAIAYDLFLKGETALAVATLQKLGEDVETCLKELLFGTVNRSLRNQLSEEMKKYGYLRSFEVAILERISLIERIYPSSCFANTYLFRKKEMMRTSTDTPEQNILHLLHPYGFRNLIIECGEVDGVVLGSWTSFNGSSIVPDGDEDCSCAGYWAAAAIWSSVWDQKTIDRILLDQPSFMGVHLMWESQLEYQICHNDWEETSKLLDMIPNSLLHVGSLQISLDGLQPASTECNMEFHDQDNYIRSPQELDAVRADIPNIRILRSSVHIMCSSWLGKLIDKELAKKFIFLKEYWDDTAEIVCVMARSGFVAEKAGMPCHNESMHCTSDLDFTDICGEFHPDTVQAFHKIVVHHFVQYNLPHLLDLYLDHHKLALDSNSLSLLQDAAGDCHWAKWLLFSRIKGREYDASFSNALAIVSRRVVPGSSLTVLETDEIISTVDDIAERGWLMAALATLMFAPLPIQNCLSTGSVNRRFNYSAQCTLENLRPALQHFPTLWRALVAACLGQDTARYVRGTRIGNVPRNSSLANYLNWRDSIFYSSGHDTSLVQMLPSWFPKSVRRLVQIFVQGPLGWQSMADLPAGEAYLQRDTGFLVNEDEYSEISPMSWEAAVQKQIEQELYSSSVEGTGLGLEHHLHRGRALAAFNHLLGHRVEKLKSEGINRGQSGDSVRGPANVQSDVQTLLASLTQNEESLLSSVMPLAITNYQNTVLVASCAFLLELCGISASMLRMDVAALRRISDFYKSTENVGQQKQLSLKVAAFHTTPEEGAIADSLARAFADTYLHQDSGSITKQEVSPNTNNHKQCSRSLMLVLQQLEKASLPILADGKTCGSWLLSGNGDGSELRSQQKLASQHWSLVTAFCQMHQIPLSTKYLALLARDNDWVGFLSEAQAGGYPFNTVIQVAAEEFSDACLRTHILTVLRGMQSRKKASLSSSSDCPENPFFPVQNNWMPVELFGILAECEKQKHPGKALLVKAKELRWSILAMVASCFADVSPFSCLTVWLEITAARDTSITRTNGIFSQIANDVGAAVKATNSLPTSERILSFHYNRKNQKRRRLMDPMEVDSSTAIAFDARSASARASFERANETQSGEHINVSSDTDEWPDSLPKMVSVLCERQQFLPLLRAFEMFLPSSSLLPFIRALQAFSQMRLSEASAHLGSFSARTKEEPFLLLSNFGREGQTSASWITSTAMKAADAILLACPSTYEKRCLLELLAATDFGDGGSTGAYYRRQYWKIKLAEPALCGVDDLQLGNDTLDDAALLTALEKNGHWEQARTWARQLEASGGPWKSAVHHVTETQAESMVAEWKEFLWDVPEERVALWGHCQTLFIRYSFPALQAGLFFLKHAEVVEKDLPPRELHEMLLLSLQWLSGIITQSNPVYPLNLLREIETKVWLLAVESEAQVKNERDFNLTSTVQDWMPGNGSNIVDRTATIVTKMDNHISAMKIRTSEKFEIKENNLMHLRSSQTWDTGIVSAMGSTKAKRRAKAYGPTKRSVLESVDKSSDLEDGCSPPLYSRNDLQDESFKIETSFSRWEDTIGPGELERAVLSLLEFGQITAAKQLHHKLSPGRVPFEFKIADAALKLAELSTPIHCIPLSFLDEDLRSEIQSYNVLTDGLLVDPLQVLESLSAIFTEGSGRGLCKRIIAVVKAANVLGISFLEAFGKQSTELLQLLSLKAQDSFEEAKFLVQTHSLPATSIAQILAESFLKGLLAAHRGGYIDSQSEEGPAPLLWRFSDFLRWAELCPSEPEIGHALMRLVITGQEIPHACEVELLILSHHFYKSSACLDGVDVLVALAATRVEAYVSEGDFSCLARLITGVGNFHALNFILGILIENGQLDLLLQKYSAAVDVSTGTAEAVRGFRMAVLTSLKHFNPNDLDAFAMVYNHFDMKHETASLLELRAEQSSRQWFNRYYKDQNEDLLESMRYYIEAAEVHSSIDAGNKTRVACAQASLLSLQIRMPDNQWLNLSETNARRALVEQSQFQEALIVAEAYNLNQPSEWALVLWNQMLKPELIEPFVAEFVAALPLQSYMLLELARFYRAEIAARGDQSQFSVWLTGGLPAEWAKYLGRSFRCLLKRTRDLRLRLQLASVATGFSDVINTSNKALDKVPENAGPLVLRKGHGGAYLPLM